MKFLIKGFSFWGESPIIKLKTELDQKGVQSVESYYHNKTGYTANFNYRIWNESALWCMYAHLTVHDLCQFQSGKLVIWCHCINFINSLLCLHSYTFIHSFIHSFGCSYTCVPLPAPTHPDTHKRLLVGPVWALSWWSSCWCHWCIIWFGLDSCPCVN